MTIVVGGLRARFIRDSVFEMIKAAVIDLGWTDPARQHKPIYFSAQPGSWDEEVALNTVAVTQTDVRSEDSEMGSNLQEDRWTFYVDLFAEDESVGTHLIHDVRDILRGKMPSIGRGRPNVTVMDYSLALPAPLFTCDIEDVVIDRANDFPKPWQRYWYVCRFIVVDEYGDEDDT